VISQYLRNSGRLLVATSIVFLGSYSNGFAIDWAGGTGDYNAGANWVGGVAPTNGDEITISSGQATLNANFERKTNSTINGTGTLTVNGRLLNARAGGPATITVADNATFNVTGNYFIISQENNPGTLTQTGGTVNAVIDRGFMMSDGALQANASNGVINALGGVFNASLVTTSPNENLHNFQAGRRGPNDTLYVNGGDVNFSTSVANRRIYFSQNSLLQVDSGSYDANGFEYFVIGYGTSLNGGNVSGTSRMLVNGGVSTINLTPTGTFVVSDGQSGVVDMNNGTLNVTGKMVIGGDVSANNNVGRGDVYQRGGTLNISGNIAMGVNAPGSYRILGGTLNAGSLSKGNQLDSFFGYEGGTVVLNGNVTSIVNEPWFAAPYGVTANYNAGTDKTTLSRNPAIQRVRLEVNTQTGEAKIKNPNGAFPFKTDYYEIRSAQGALLTTNWNSLDNQIPDGGALPGDFDSNGTVNGRDFLLWQRNSSVGSLADWKANYGSSGGSGIGSGWTEAGGSNANLLAEYFLDADAYTLANNASFSLGNIFNTATFGAGNSGDLTFSVEMPNGYLAVGEVVYVNSLMAISSIVPEPSSLVMLVGAALLLVNRRRPE
jgi:hypothetical protein